MRAQEAAKKLWSEGVPVPRISEELGIPGPMVWRWRYRNGWPSRTLLANRGDAVVYRALEAWNLGLPRAEIALRCNVSLSTLDHWRVRYNWTRRPPGRRSHGILVPDLGLRQQEQARLQQLKERAELREQHIAAARQRFRKTLPRWRCCDRLLDVPVCPECHRRIPVCA